MADLEKWTKAAREAENNSVIVAVPVQSREAVALKTYFDAGTGSMVEFILGGALMGLLALNMSVRRFKDRRKQLGKRDNIDRVAILFYPDRVDLHSRKPFLKRVGKHVESHPMSVVERPTAMNIRIGDVLWQHSVLKKNQLEDLLSEHGIELATGEDD